MILSSLVFLGSCGQRALEQNELKQQGKANVFVYDFRTQKSNTLHAQATVRPDVAYDLENSPYVDVTLTTGENLVYENRDGHSITAEDELLGESSEIADMMEEYQTYVDEVTPASTGGLSAQGAGIISSTTVCTFRFVFCWRTRTTANQLRWPNNSVPYSYESSVTPSQRTVINNAIVEWNSRVGNVKWQYNETASNRIAFRTHTYTDGTTRGDSYVGRQLAGIQPVRYAPWIYTNSIARGVIHHEMGHASGLIHEHQRCDRDTYLYVAPALSSNSAFTKRCTGYNTYTAYDYESVMHYGPSSSSFQAYTPQRSGSTGNPFALGQRQGLSVNDVSALNSIYR